MLTTNKTRKKINWLIFSLKLVLQINFSVSVFASLPDVNIVKDVYCSCWCISYMHVFSEAAERWALSSPVILLPLGNRPAQQQSSALTPLLAVQENEETTWRKYNRVWMQTNSVQFIMTKCVLFLSFKSSLNLSEFAWNKCLHRVKQMKKPFLSVLSHPNYEQHF